MFFIKNKFLKIFIALILVGTVFSPALKSEAAEPKAIIFATPNQAKQIGQTITTTATVSRADLNKLSNILDNNHTMTAAHTGLITAIVTIPIKRAKLSAPLGISTGVLSAFAKGKHATVVTNALKKSSNSSFKVTINYKYRQINSGAGGYYITSIKVK